MNNNYTLIFIHGDDVVKVKLLKTVPPEFKCIQIKQKFYKEWNRFMTVVGKQTRLTIDLTAF